MKVISMETANAIWRAHREIQAGRNLLIQVDERKTKDSHGPTPLDGWRTRGYQLGLPMSDTSHQLIDVSIELVPAIIHAHIAQKECELAELCAKAQLEMYEPMENAPIPIPASSDGTNVDTGFF